MHSSPSFKFGIGLAILAMSVAEFAALPAARAADDCSTLLGGPDPEKYWDIAKRGDVSAEVHEDGTATFTNDTNCTIRLSLHSLAIDDNDFETLYRSSSVIVVQANTTATLTVPVPFCRHRVTLQPYYQTQRPKNGRSILYSTDITDNLPACTVQGTTSVPIVGSQVTSVRLIPPPPDNAPRTGCILVRVLQTDMAGRLRSEEAPEIRILLHDGKKEKEAYTDRYGYAWFKYLSKDKDYVVSQELPDGWTQTSATPRHGNITIHANESCQIAIFTDVRRNPSSTAPGVTITTSPDRPAPGQTIRYSLVLSNESNRNKTETVSVSYDDGLFYVSSARTPRFGDHSVTWDDVFIPARSTVTMVVSFGVRADMPHTEPARLEAWVGDAHLVQLTAVRMPSVVCVATVPTPSQVRAAAPVTSDDGEPQLMPQTGVEWTTTTVGRSYTLTPVGEVTSPSLSLNVMPWILALGVIVLACVGGWQLRLQWK